MKRLYSGGTLDLALDLARSGVCFQRTWRGIGRREDLFRRHLCRASRAAATREQSPRSTCQRPVTFPGGQFRFWGPTQEACAAVLVTNVFGCFTIPIRSPRGQRF
ncbi:hypothetical protein NDU88_005835 [Pleurodeles waltl]|uniref:Uncharacterized protein n=1 Tax=Pleurodeles waltl TaxID=8319 RepID=A0AAV7L587_PLEWA|nr:hypothetical protein NDU88_005835 [Pleurodeles waltl]